MDREPQTHNPSTAKSRATRGFTLIELMIAVVILGILGALAYPSFMDAIYKGRRSEAFAALTSVQLAQERYRANSASYAASLAELYTALQSTAPEPNNYTLSIPEATASSYRVRAVARNAQYGDSRCGTMEVLVERGSISYSPTTNGCWSRP
jgi:type IV pilus assembly protein PilE